MDMGCTQDGGKDMGDFQHEEPAPAGGGDTFWVITSHWWLLFMLFLAREGTLDRLRS